MATTEQSHVFTTDGYEGFPSTIAYELSSVGGGLVMSSANETHSMKSQLAAYDILIPLLGTLIIITNGAVVISSGLLLKKGQQPRCTYLLLGNVAMADLITGIAVIVGQAYPKTNRTHYSCAFQLGMIVSSTIASIYSVGLIAVDRFLYILYGLKYHRWVYPTRARCMIAATWLLGLVIGYLPLMGWAGDTQNGKICWFIMMAPPNLIILTTIVGVSPVFLVIVLYSIILYNAIKKVIQLNKIGKENGESDGHNSSNLRMFRGGASAAAKKPTVKTIQEEAIETSEEKEDRAAAVEESSETKPERSRMRKILDKVKGKKREDEESQQQPDKNQPNKWKAIKVVFFTTGSFVCTWLPYFVACSAYVFCDFHESPQRCQKLKYAIASPLAILGFLNSLLNPVIYAWWHNGFRKGIKKLCCRKRNAANMAIGQKAASSSSSNRPTSSQTFKPNSSTG